MGLSKENLRQKVKVTSVKIARGKGRDIKCNTFEDEYATRKGIVTITNRGQLVFASGFSFKELGGS